jgi:hypothetical protein
MDIYDTNKILPETNLVNPSNSHFSDPVPQFSSNVGPVTGCNGSINTPLALNGKGIYSYKHLGGKNKKSKRNHIRMKSTYSRKGKMSRGKKSRVKRSGGKKSCGKKSRGKRSGGKKSCSKKRRITRRGGKRIRGGGMFKGYVAFSPSYSIDVKAPLAPNQSALSSPPPIKRMNDCLNTWKHLGSEKKPYNKVWN